MVLNAQPSGVNQYRKPGSILSNSARTNVVGVGLDLLEQQYEHT